MKASDLRNGMAIKVSGQINVILNTEHVKPGKGPAYVQVKTKNIESGSVLEKRLRSVEEVDQVDIDRRPMEFLYNDGAGLRLHGRPDLRSDDALRRTRRR